MMAVHKITDDFYDNSFTLIALHSSLEDYAMVYALNLCLKSNFCRASIDLELSEAISFPIFDWNDKQNDNYWTLITNTHSKEESLIGNDLFANEPSFTKHYLVPEHKEADYLLKIEHDEGNLNEEVVKRIQAIPKVITAYILEPENLKSKKNLIF